MQTNDFFQVYEGYFWQWEDKGDLLVIRGGNSIAYHEHIEELMTALSVQGLPSFGALLLTVIATNPYSGNSLGFLKSKFVSISKQFVDSNLECQINQAFRFLELLSGLPQEIRTGQKKILLLQTIFQGAHNCTSIKDAQTLTHQLKARRMPGNQEIPLKPFVLTKDLRPLALLSTKYQTEETIINALLAMPEDGIELELEEAKQQGDLLSDLIQEPKTFHIGSLVKNLWAGLYLPIHYATASEQPLGGISDISNKGEFDKLLISEFAHEELVFMSRLANSEALYINRESPPLNDMEQRNILIDISLYNWGTPKTIAFAIMLALVHQPKQKISYKVYLVGDRCFSVNFATVKDLIDIQAHVDSCLYPYDGISDFFDNRNRDKSETIVITNSESMKQGLQKVVNQYRKDINYLIFANNWGKIDLYRVLKNNSKHIQSLTLDLKNCWKQEKEIKEVITAKTDFTPPNFGIPLILISPKVGPEIMSVGQEYYCVFQSKLLKRVQSDKGWYIVYDKIEKSLSAHQLGVNESNELILLLCYDNRKKIELHNLDTGEIKTESFRKYVCFQQRTLVFYENQFHILCDKSYKGSVSLDLNIKIFDVDSSGEDLLKFQRNSMSEFREYYRYTSIWNVKEIAIVNDYTLIINKKHQLFVSESRLLFRYYNYNTDNIREVATFDPENREFRLKNGVVLSSSMGVLHILLKDKRKIQIPMVLEVSLAMALGDRVSGNMYFHTQHYETAQSDRLDEEMFDLLIDKTTWS